MGDAKGIDMTSDASKFVPSDFELPRWMTEWWQAVVWAPLWAVILAVVAVVGLMLAFHGVVRGAVEQGEERRLATAALTQATWRCNALRGLGASGACLAQLSASAAVDVSLVASR
jgi:hypothetical protein